MTEPFVVDEVVLAELARAREEARVLGEAQEKLPVDRVEDLDAGGVPARLYEPGHPAGTILYLHGGGFAMGDLVTHDGFARQLATRTGWAVLLVDYRRSPEHPFPAALEDASAAADWLADHRPGPLAVVGDSAGSALAIAQALRTPERWVAQVQVYPFVDPSCRSYDAALDERGGVDLPVERCRLFWELYLQGDPGDEALHVLDRGDLTGQPPALVQLAELDVLTPTGHRYAERLREAGAQVRVEVHPGVQHGFWRQVDNQQSGPALDTVAAFLSAFRNR